MKVIGLVGVSGSGKTTLMNELTSKLPGSIGVPEATKGEILDYCKLPVRAISEFSSSQLAKYDIGRVELSLKVERVFLAGDYKYVIFEKPTIISLMYFLQYSSRFKSVEVIDSLVKEVVEHTHKYNLIYHLPANSFDTTKDKLNRNVTNSWVLSTQDAMLLAMLKWVWIWEPFTSLETIQGRVKTVLTDIALLEHTQKQNKQPLK